MTTTYKFRTYPKKILEEKLETAKEICRQTYNHLLSELNDGYSKNETQNMLLDLKIIYPETNNVHSKVLQMENQRLFSNLSSLSALKKKGHKVGRLRFKGKDWFKTFTYNQSGFKLTHIRGKKGNLWLSKIGDIPIKLHRPIEGNILNITMKESNEKWYACVTTDAVIKRQCGTGEIGIDVGIENYIYDSNGNAYENPKHFYNYHQELKIAQQSLARKKKGSNSRRKERRRVSKIHEKIKNARDDFLHKLSTKLIRENKFIAIEKLDIKNLMHIAFNSKNIADASWGRLACFLHYKAENAGGVVQDVDPAYSTRDCNFCGYRNRKLELWQRQFCCSNCGKEMNRDYNAALNLLARGKELASMEKASHTERFVQQDASMKSEAITST